MANTKQFELDLQKGRELEVIFEKWCEKNGVGCEDATELRGGYDYIISSRDNKKKSTLDVKKCSFKDGAGCVEIYTRNGGKGWFRREDASQLYVFMDRVEEYEDLYCMYTISHEEIDRYIEEYNSRMSKLGEGTEGYYIPLNENNKYMKYEQLTIMEWLHREGIGKNRELWLDSEGRTLAFE